MNDQQNKDAEHLRLLSIFHYVFAGIVALFSFFPIIYLVIGIIFIVAPEGMETAEGEPPPEFLGWIFVGFSVAFFVLALVLAFLVLLTGKSLTKRKRRTFCIVIGAIECLFFPPLGTALGVFTIIVLMRDSVAELFGKNQPSLQGNASDEFDRSF